MIRFNRFSIVVILVVLLDQITKYFSQNVVKNTGASFGLLTGYNWFFVLISFFVIGLIIYYKQNLKNYGLIGLGFLMGGVVGNLLDRLVFGYVRDFIRIFSWPAFNLADVCNVVGVLILFWYFLKR